ncbi:MAG: type II toxin-antitoxin system VapC family toxin [Desulfurococcales archaeon]|nr:type II toxin-antitoxin system VapC family toxin [Desulfurococcales archaeon]
MAVVVDASALAAFILREEGWEELGEYMVRCVSVDHVVKEVANTIWKAACVRKLMTADEARRAYGILLRMIGKNIVLRPELEYLSKALEISMKHSITVYDSLYIALALEENKPLLTLDKQQAQVAKKLKINTIP